MKDIPLALTNERTAWTTGVDGELPSLERMWDVVRTDSHEIIASDVALEADELKVRRWAAGTESRRLRQRIAAMVREQSLIS